MTEAQKKRIAKLRQQGLGYTTIASELRLSVSTVKSFCRRNKLQAEDLEHDTQRENLPETPHAIDLISSESRGNTMTAKQPRVLVNTGVSGDQPICEVTVSYADEPDLGAVADVMDLLMHANYNRR